MGRSTVILDTTAASTAIGAALEDFPWSSDSESLGNRSLLFARADKSVAGVREIRAPLGKVTASVFIVVVEDWARRRPATCGEPSARQRGEHLMMASRAHDAGWSSVPERGWAGTAHAAGLVSAHAAGLVTVLGAGRSGTSAIARAVMALGVDFGDDLRPGGGKNPTGFFEDQALLALNKRLKRALAIRGDSVRLIEPAEWESPEVRALRTEAAR